MTIHPLHLPKRALDTQRTHTHAHTHTQEAGRDAELQLFLRAGQQLGRRAVRAAVNGLFGLVKLWVRIATSSLAAAAVGFAASTVLIFLC